MAKTKTLTTSRLIHSIKLRAAIPSTDNTFTEEDFLYFINEEIDLGVVPHIQAYKEDYFLYSEFVDIIPGQNRYSIPNRAVGTKLRDVSYDTGSGLVEFTRISVEDLSDRFFNFHNTDMKAFYVEGDEIVIPENLQNGRLKFSYYIRPNVIVSEDDICVVNSINKNSGLVFVDKLPESMLDAEIFDITSSKSSFRLVSKEISPEGVPTPENLTFTFGTIKKASYTLPLFSSIVSSSFIQLIDNSEGLSTKNIFWFDKTGSDVAPSIPNSNLYRVDISLALNNTQVVTALTSVFNSAFINKLIMTPDNDFTIENGGVGISVGDNFTVTSSFTLTEVIESVGTVTIPTKLNTNDVIALPEETSIPQIPIELHAMLAQRVAMRCLESLGDTAGLQAAAAKLADMEIKTGNLLNDRVESAPLKIVPRHSLVRKNSRNSYGR